MTPIFDTIVKSGTVVNRDGETIRDIGVTARRIAVIGSLGSCAGAG